MPSPFPGMNPWIENEDPWHTFHEAFCAKCLEILVPQLRPKYIVQSDENVYIHEFSAEERRLAGRPDLSIMAGATASPQRAGPAAATATMPVYASIPAAVDVAKESYLAIRDRRSRELITVIELLSPANKRLGPDREQYLAKRRHYLRSRSNFVEIDLLRGGPRMPLDQMPDCDYYVLVDRVEVRPRVPVWPVRLRDRLPSVAIPLRVGDAEPTLDVQEVLHLVYDGLAFADYIYENSPQPPLHPEDAAWAARLLGG
jgi:hypothetical protein